MALESSQGALRHLAVSYADVLTRCRCEEDAVRVTEERMRVSFIKVGVVALLGLSLVAIGLQAIILWRSDSNAVVQNISIDQPVIVRTKGGLLEVSVIKSPEIFTATKDHNILGVPVGKTVSQIRVPASYHYQIELAPEWKILLRDKTFIVVAPRVKPSLPIGIETSKLEQHASGIWSLVTGSGQLQLLLKSISATLATKGESAEFVEFQRNEARKTVTEFVRKWLVTQEKWKNAAAYPIRVFFADEPIEALRGLPPPFAGLR